MHRTVGLVNVDLCVGGPIAIPESSAVLKDMFVNALKMAGNNYIQYIIKIKIIIFIYNL